MLVCYINMMLFYHCSSSFLFFFCTALSLPLSPSPHFCTPSPENEKILLGGGTLDIRWTERLDRSWGTRMAIVNPHGCVSPFFFFRFIYFNFFLPFTRCPPRAVMVVGPFRNMIQREWSCMSKSYERVNWSFWKTVTYKELFFTQSWGKAIWFCSRDLSMLHQSWKRWGITLFFQ